MKEPIYRKLKNGRYQEIIIPTGKEAIGSLNDDQKTALLHISLAAFETVRADEKPKSTRYTRMNNSIDRILDQIDVYRIEAWPNDKIQKASLLVDIFNVMIALEFEDIER